MGESFKAREERRALLLSARMLAEQGWRDVTVCNVSSRGMMLRSEDPPDRNAFVEIRHRNACIVGRVIWSRGTCFGIRTQDRVDLCELLSQSPPAPRKLDVERRLSPRSESPSLFQMRALPLEDSSRVFARLLDWCAIVFAVALGAIFVADIASEALQEPLGEVRHALHGQDASG